MTSQYLIISSTRAPGDITSLTGFVRDLHLARPGLFITDVNTTTPELWDNNPYITRFRHNPPKDCRYWQSDYGEGLLHSEYETVHFGAWWHRDFLKKFKVNTPVMRPYPALYLSEQEKSHRPIKERYWLIFPGGKTDFLAKLWPAESWIGLVDKLHITGINSVQMGNGNTRGDVKHVNPDIPNTNLNLVGQTNLRETLQLIHHADGVICGNSFPMHAAAALGRPCVVIAGGREMPGWFSYVRNNVGLGPEESRKHLTMPHRVLHTVTQLDCCQHHGCQKCNVLPGYDDGSKPLCLKPVLTGGGAYGFCMTMISVEQVVTAVLSYYMDGSLPSLSTLRPVSSNQKQNS